ncbi:PilN domain-containing protein [Tumidithrix elongata RA019]|uniref:PilN domain-containing protein n=1 Tax=Tumidithrix elongata BACA0141 TaxID=2716417 RepID=A0AAW9PZR8_9CYAN|nr:PilN domain-containing protein [Tumidithrix elongata RA019]
MYSLDINFLSDRETLKDGGVERQPIADSQFLLYGGIVAVVCLAATAGAYFFLDYSNQSLVENLAKLTAEEGDLNTKLKAVEGTEKQLLEVEARTNELLNLFVGQLPVNAVLDDIKRRTPATVQVISFAQSGKDIKLDGQATTYNELNDFMLLLQSSRFLDSSKTRLVSAILIPATKDKPFSAVSYKIETSVTAENSAQLLPELQKAGADGLVTRVNLLQQQGVIPK